MSRRQAGICLAAGLVALIAAPFVWAWLTPDPAGETVTDLNAAAAVALADPTSGSAIAAGPVQVTAAAPGTGAEAVTTPSAAPEPAAPSATDPVPVVATTPVAPPVITTSTTAAPPAAEPSSPVRLELPTLGIDSPVIPVGVTDGGILEVPEDVDDVGWYRFGPAPGGTAGSAVLTGHVDSARQGPGPFARLSELAIGDTVTVVDDTGATRSFSVLSREEWSKSEVPLDRIFDREGSPRLVLITCGGQFDASIGHYEDNIAITAVPVSGGQG